MDEDYYALKAEYDKLAATVDIQAAVLKRLREKSLRWNQRISHWYKQAEAEYATKHIKRCRVCGKEGHNYD